MLYACATCVNVWKTAHTSFLDRVLTSNGFRLLSLCWEAIELLKDDPDHFTWGGFKAFANSLVSVLQNQGVKKVHIFSDSTVDFHNWTKEWKTRHGAAHKYLRSCLTNASIECKLDSWSGSGFVQASTFSERARETVQTGWDVLVVGGWNDTACERVDVKSGVRDMVEACSGPRCPPRRLRRETQSQQNGKRKRSTGA
tara:strand:- start:744 stop:1337 length:594 start_codon:yes stop_codon:yes gene_type:complete